VCGIAGVVEQGAEVEQRALALASTLTHRGPDSVGAFTGHGTSLAQSRLRVIDLVTGDPPITNEDGTKGVAFNGEIYNYRELRHELESTGHHFTTTGDTEVIAHLADELGPAEMCRRRFSTGRSTKWSTVARSVNDRPPHDGRG
jgi:asparagine synthase (glutamine-hydrolysing)